MLIMEYMFVFRISHYGSVRYVFFIFILFYRLLYLRSACTGASGSVYLNKIALCKCVL